MNPSQPKSHPHCGSCGTGRLPKSFKRRWAATSTALTWFVVNSLILSQSDKSVHAFGTFSTHQNQLKVSIKQSNYAKHAFKSSRKFFQNYDNIKSLKNLKDSITKYNGKVSRVPDTTKTTWKISSMNENRYLSSEIDEQFAVDRYLESIDRRYKRVHQSEANDDTPQRGFTNAWAWIRADESALKEQKQRTEKDALYVLGLAELASARLLVKHHLPITQSQQFSHRKDITTIDVQAEKDATTFSIQTAFTLKHITRTLNDTRKTCTYHCAIVSLHLRVLFYNTLRFAGSIFTRFLVALSAMVSSTTGGKFVSYLAAMVAMTMASCTTVVSRTLKT